MKNLSSVMAAYMIGWGVFFFYFVTVARRTAESFQKESGIPVTFLGTNTPVGLPPEMTLEVLQMLREALHNVQKHAGASRVAVAIEQTDRGLEISVDDNGHGFSFAGTYTLEELELLRLGPASLKRRARSLSVTRKSCAAAPIFLRDFLLAALRSSVNRPS